MSHAGKALAATLTAALIFTPSAHAAGELESATNVVGASGKRITYTSTNEAGETVKVTGALYDTKRAKGLIALAPGTRGMGDHCAPSAGVGMVSSISGSSINVNYEVPFVKALTRAGYRVVVTDYIGLGTDGTHTYLNRVDQGHALIDAARATANPNEKVGFWGYSQGGGAAAAAAELVGTYAPELNVVGTFAGAPPADPLAVLEQAPEWMITPVTGFALISYAETYPELAEAMEDVLTDEGVDMLRKLAGACTIDGAAIAPKPFRAYTKTGQSIGEIARGDERIANALNHNKLGNVPTQSPILVMTNPTDDIVPFEQASQLAADYCALGSPVEFRRVRLAAMSSHFPGAGHTAPLVLEADEAIDWMDDRFAGRPFHSKCPGEQSPANVAAIVIGVLAGALALTGLANFAWQTWQQYVA